MRVQRHDCVNGRAAFAAAVHVEVAAECAEAVDEAAAHGRPARLGAMAQSPADPDSFRETGEDAGDHDSITGTPRWVKLFGIVAVVLVLLVVILILTGGGGHGPGRHAVAGHADGQPAPSRITELGGPGRHEPAADRHAA